MVIEVFRVLELGGAFVRDPSPPHVDQAGPKPPDAGESATTYLDSRMKSGEIVTWGPVTARSGTAVRVEGAPVYQLWNKLGLEPWLLAIRES